MLTLGLQEFADLANKLRSF